jgi:hypothetical protein
LQNFINGSANKLLSSKEEFGVGAPNSCVARPQVLVQLAERKKNLEKSTTACKTRVLGASFLGLPIT